VSFIAAPTSAINQFINGGRSVSVLFDIHQLNRELVIKRRIYDKHVLFLPV